MGKPFSLGSVPIGAVTVSCKKVSTLGYHGSVKIPCTVVRFEKPLINNILRKNTIKIL